GHILYSDADPETLDRFRRSNVVVAQAMRSDEPLARSDASSAIPHLYEGENLIVPLAATESATGVAVLAGDEPDLSPVTRSVVHGAAETAFDRARELPPKENAVPSGGGLLSAREAAILSWAAAGRTDAQIGEQLKISARTVRFHTDNAKRKLRVSSRIQA